MTLDTSVRVNALARDGAHLLHVPYVDGWCYAASLGYNVLVTAIRSRTGAAAEVVRLSADASLRWLRRSPCFWNTKQF